jgi:uncharacterized protein (TIGR02284 family)
MPAHIDNLKNLHTILIDSRHGYQEALEDAGVRGLTGLFRDMIAMRTKDIAETAALITAAGGEAHSTGSIMTTVNKVIISIRSLFGELDERILPGLINGERRIVTYYDDALETAETETERETLERQRTKVQAVIAAMARMNAIASAA